MDREKQLKTMGWCRPWAPYNLFKNKRFSGSLAPAGPNFRVLHGEPEATRDGAPAIDLVDEEDF